MRRRAARPNSAAELAKPIVAFDPRWRGSVHLQCEVVVVASSVESVALGSMPVMSAPPAPLSIIWNILPTAIRKTR